MKLIEMKNMNWTAGGVYEIMFHASELSALARLNGKRVTFLQRKIAKSASGVCRQTGSGQKYDVGPLELKIEWVSTSRFPSSSVASSGMY